MRRPKLLRLLAVGAVVASQLVAGPAGAATPLTVTPDLPPAMTVGTPQAVVIDVVNTSAQPVTFDNVRFVPACSSVSNGCQTVDPGHLADEQRVFVLSTPPVGAQGCAGAGFVTTQPVPGVYDLTGTVDLPAGQTCRLTLSVEAITTPLVDVQPAVPGVQTAAVAGVNATGGIPAVGVDIVTVDKAVARVDAWSDPLLVVGTPLTAIAHVLRASPRPGDSVTFRLFSDAACTAPVHTATVPVDGNGLAIADYPSSAAGVFRWTYSYSGDSSNTPLAPSACANPELTQQVVPGGTFVPLSPARIEDTRVGAGNLVAALGPGATGQVQVAGRGGIPASGVSAVVLNVTVTEPSAAGWLTLYPSGTERPLASNLNFRAGQTIPNLVVVAVGAGGRVEVFNSAGNTHVIFDVAGYYTDRPGPSGGYHAISPIRVADSRAGGAVRLGPGESIDVQVAGRGPVPVSGAEAATLNVVATLASSPSYLTVYPAGELRPLASNVNVGPYQTVANRTMTKLGAGGRVTIYNAAGWVDFIVDVGGWYDAGSSDPLSGYAPLAPARILDTRTGLGGIDGPIAKFGFAGVQVAGRGGVPATGVSAVVLNVTVTEPWEGGWLSLFPYGPGLEGTSDLNFAAGETRPNLVVVQADSRGWVGLTTWASTHVVIDVAGYFT